jgi:NDP-sugar pyrophosphorylase family protein
MTITYIIKVGDIYKIGKTTNLNNRMKDYKQYHKEDIIIVLSYIGDIEQFLLDKVRSKKIEGEWFKLTSKDLVDIRHSLTKL